MEVAAGSNTTPAGYLEVLKKGVIPSKLRVLFSTITKIKQLQYIPVKVRYGELSARDHMATPKEFECTLNLPSLKQSVKRCHRRLCHVQEDLIVSEGDKNISLVSFLGPFKFSFDGEYTVTGDYSFDFQFTRSTVELFGSIVRQSSMSGKPKTYTYVLNSSGVAVARSSGGGLTLLVQPSLITKKEWKPDFLATKL